MLNAEQFITLSCIWQMAALIYIAKMWHYSSGGCWATVIHKDERYELTRTS